MNKSLHGTLEEMRVKFPSIYAANSEIMPIQLEQVKSSLNSFLLGDNIDLRFSLDKFQMKVNDIIVLGLFTIYANISDTNWHNLSAEGPLRALQMALEHRNTKAALVYHSDRGLQYCSKDYIKQLSDKHIAISMTENGDPYENALAERINGILKNEFDLNKTFKNLEQAKEWIDQATEVYNNKRPHSSCDYLTPNQAYQSTGVLKNKWKKEKTIFVNLNQYGTQRKYQVVTVEILRRYWEGVPYIFHTCPYIFHGIRVFLGFMGVFSPPGTGAFYHYNARPSPKEEGIRRLSGRAVKLIY